MLKKEEKKVIIMTRSSLLLFLMMCSIVLFQCKNRVTLSVNYGGEDLVLKKTYHPNGIVKTEMTYKNKNDELVAWGYGKLFNEKGGLEYFANYINGKRVGDAIEYWNTGNPKKYWFFDPLSRAIYSSEYSEKGDLSNEEGKLKIQMIVSDATPKVGDTVYFEIYYPAPPHLTINTIKVQKDTSEWGYLPKLQPFTTFEDKIITHGAIYYKFQLEYAATFDSFILDDSIYLNTE